MRGDPLELVPAHARRQRKPTTERERQAEGDKLSKAYRRWQKEQRDALRALHPELMGEIDGQFRAATLVHLAGLLEWILTNNEIARLEQTQRPVLLRYLSARLTALREAAGLPPFDDQMPDDPGPADPARNAFILFRRLLAGF